VPEPDVGPEAGAAEPDTTPRPGRAVALSALVVRLTAPNPGMMTGPGTNSYLVGRTSLTVVDPGPDDPGHVERLAELGAGRIDHIVVTHTHRDHAPAAARLAARTGARVLGFAERDGFVPGRVVGDGFELRGRDGTLRAVHTPGHASDHCCWLLVEEATLFSGDHVMHGSTVVIAPPDGDMTSYLESLRRLLTLEPALARILPGHGSHIDDPATAVRAVIEHRLRRESAVAAALARARRATVDELLPEVYGDVGVELLPVARFSLWAHLRKLGEEGRARPDGPAEPWAAWSSA
jgi:glyoxylase-like metal-dependent hydrolase (beta-lactamase superfamily II)